MFEIGVICIVMLAVGYWVTLWLMGRHEDVLHGDFIHAEQGVDASQTLGDQPFPFPARVPFPAKPPAVTPASRKPATAATQPASTSPGPSPDRAEPSDTLQSLLASIKRDLKDASRL